MKDWWRVKFGGVWHEIDLVNQQPAKCGAKARPIEMEVYSGRGLPEGGVCGRCLRAK